MTIYSRSEIKKLLKKDLVMVNGEVIKDPGFSVDESMEVLLDGKNISYVEYEYYLLNKPQGYICATEDECAQTIMELIVSKRKDLFPVGRLDKNTEGLIIVTNDGKLAHDLISKNNHCEKKYYVEVDADLPESAKKTLEKPMNLGDFVTQGGKYEKLTDRTAYLTISEGKYHQVKRMFSKIGCEVTFLKRVQFGFLDLQGLQTGQYRPLSSEEVNKLKQL